MQITTTAISDINTDTNDTASDATTDIANITDDITQITPSQPSSPTPTDIYHFIEQRLLSLDPLATMALRTLNYHDNFHPHFFPPDKEGGFGKTLYKVSPPGGDVETDELALVFFGEICSSSYGTAMSAKGNHYVGTPEYPKVRNTHS